MSEAIPNIISTCCAAPVEIRRSRCEPPGWESHWYACSKCGQPCDDKPLDTESPAVHSEAQQSTNKPNEEGAGHE